MQLKVSEQSDTQALKISKITNKRREILTYAASSIKRKKDSSFWAITSRSFHSKMIISFLFLNSWEFSSLVKINFCFRDHFGSSFRSPFFSIDLAHTCWLPSHCKLWLELDSSNKGREEERSFTWPNPWENIWLAT